jgi:RND family efflux transporter MFP subunit
MNDKQRILRIAVTVLAVIIALFAARWLWIHYRLKPWTRDGRVRMDVVEVAPDVAGLVTHVHVRDNSLVRRGQVLFEIDQVRYRLALAQADAAVATQEANLAEANREAYRNRVLGRLVSIEAGQQQDTRVAAFEAALADAIAARDTARVNLVRTVVRASVDGIATDVELRPGDYAHVGEGVIALVDLSTLRIEGYFEETKLPRIHVGDHVKAYLMGHTKPIEGHVESIVGGVVDRERQPTPSLLPNINPTFNWVRLAQRIPVRIHIDRVPPEQRLVSGLTVTVYVHSTRAEDDLSFWPW